MVRPFCLDPKNNSKIKPLKGNAIGFNPLSVLTDQSPSTAKIKSKRLYALQSRWVTDRKRVTSHYFEDVFSSKNEKETKDSLQDSFKDTQYDDIFTFGDTDFVDRKKKTFKEVTDSTSPIKQFKRKNRMRDEFGNIVHHVKMKNPVAKKTTSPKHPQSPNGLTLSIRCFRVGTLTKTFTKTNHLASQCILTVDCIKIGNEGRIDASDVMACEWCTVQRLPALFLQTTPETCHQLQLQLDMFEEDSRVWCNCRSRNEKEKYVVLIFENELTLLEQVRLEEIFTEIGKRNNVSCFPVKLSFEEASNRLKTHSCAQKQEIVVLFSEDDDDDDDLPVINQSFVAFSPSPDAPRYEITTLSVSDSDEEDFTEFSSSPKLAMDKLVVYPPPPAKRGLTITEEDLKCLEEGKFLNDVIIDFYLRYLVCKQQEKEDVSKYHVFSSFFFKHLTQEDHQRLPGTTGLSVQERQHNRVKTWTRNVNLFEKDFIFIPINQMAHWYLAVICFPGKISQTSGVDLRLHDRKHSVEYLSDQTPPNPMSLFYSPESSKQDSRWSHAIEDRSGFFLSDDEPQDDIQAVEDRSVFSRESNFSKRPCILIMDSLSSSGRSSVVQILQQYLQEEWKAKMGSQQTFGKMNGWSPLVPQQDNFTDCGIFLLQYVESFLKDPPQTFHDNMDLNSWFSQRTVKRKRGKLKRLILKLHRQQRV